ncbi:hypothetical protein OAB00_04550 [Akkermansiaceae bacterium]|nr:hypothetical protein [Akkermansiaceae bacterium]
MQTKIILAILSAFAALVIPSCYIEPAYSANGPVVAPISVNTSLRVLPYGYQTVYVGGSPYYYHGKSWYTRGGKGYIRSSRPHGYNGNIGRSVVVSRTPYKYRPVYINGRQYYRGSNNGLFLRNNGRYSRVAEPRVSNSQRRNTSSYNRNNNSRYRTTRSTNTRQVSSNRNSNSANRSSNNTSRNTNSDRNTSSQNRNNTSNRSSTNDSKKDTSRANGRSYVSN